MPWNSPCTAAWENAGVTGYTGMNRKLMCSVSGMNAVWLSCMDFTLAGKEAYGFDDLCALYGRMKALRPDEETVYIVCAGGKAAGELPERMERCFGACKNLRVYWKEKGEKAWE